MSALCKAVTLAHLNIQAMSRVDAGAYAISPVIERASSAQHLQLASGCPSAAYWAGSFAWDMVSHLAVTLLSLAIFAAYGDEATIGSLDQVWIFPQVTRD